MLKIMAIIFVSGVLLTGLLLFGIPLLIMYLDDWLFQGELDQKVRSKAQAWLDRW